MSKMSIETKRHQIFIVLLCFALASIFLKNGLLNTALIVFYVFCFIDLDFGRKLRRTLIVPLFFPVLLFLIYLIWSIFSEDKNEAAGELLKKSPLIFLPLSFFVTKARLSEKEFNTVLATFVGMCVLASLYCYVNALVNMIENQSLSYQTPDREYYYFSYQALTAPLNIKPIYFSMLANLAFSIVLLRFHTNTWIKVSLSIYLFAFILLISSKIGMLIAIIILSLYVIEKARRKIVSFAFLFLVTSIVVLGVINLSFLRDRFIGALHVDYTEKHGHLWNSTAYRVAIWSCALEAAQDNLWLGQGTTDGQKELEKVYVKRQFVRGQLDRYNPHNEFFSTLLDLGIIGLIAIMLLVTGAIVHALHSKNRLLLYFMVIVVFSFCIESVLVRLKGIVFVSFFYSLLIWHKYYDVKS